MMKTSRTMLWVAAVIVALVLFLGLGAWAGWHLAAVGSGGLLFVLALAIMFMTTGRNGRS